VLDYHHVGIPTDIIHDGVYYLEAFGMHVAFKVDNGAPIEFIEYS